MSIERGSQPFSSETDAVSPGTDPLSDPLESGYLGIPVIGAEEENKSTPERLISAAAAAERLMFTVGAAYEASRPVAYSTLPPLYYNECHRVLWFILNPAYWPPDCKSDIATLLASAVDAARDDGIEINLSSEAENA